MELKWKIGERRRSDLYTKSKGVRSEEAPYETDVEFVILRRASAYDWEVQVVGSEFTHYVCEEWGVGNPVIGVKPVVGQLRWMTVPHIHGQGVVVVKVASVRDGKVSEAACVQCPSDWHQGYKDKWTMIDAVDHGVADTLEAPGTTKQPKQEAMMNIEERQRWALDQNWERYILKEQPKPVDANDPKAGEVWTYRRDSHAGAVVLSLGSNRCVVLAGAIFGKSKGSEEAFSRCGGRVEYGHRVLDAESTSMPKMWKIGEVRRGSIVDVRAALDAYQIIEGSPGPSQYDWRVRMLDGVDKGKTYGVKESWGSALVAAGDAQPARATDGGTTAASKADQCGDRSTAYGLVCTERKKHEGDKHRNHKSGAEWEKKDVVKLSACWYECPNGTGGMAVAVGTAKLMTTGQVRPLCRKCMLENEANIARRIGEHDKANPQPRRPERFMVQSHTLDAGGVFSLRG